MTKSKLVKKLQEKIREWRQKTWDMPTSDWIDETIFGYFLCAGELDQLLLKSNMEHETEICVTSDKPYFLHIYNTIRNHESSLKNWSDEKEKAYWDYLSKRVEKDGTRK